MSTQALGPSLTHVTRPRRRPPDGIGTALINAGTLLVLWGERLAARRAAGPRAGLDLALLQSHGEAWRDVRAQQHSGLFG
jgi:hypothetical protein